MAALQDKHTVVPLHKPPLREKFFFFASGVISSIPLTLFVEQFTNSLVGSLQPSYAILVSAVILAPFIEEFAKAFPLFYRHGETIRSIFTLGFLVGLGFGIVEFFIYVVLLNVPVILRLPGIFFHAATTSITAYGIATKRPASFYFISVFLHFANNFTAFLRSSVDPSTILGSWFILAYVATAATYYLSWYLYGKTSDRIAD